MKVFRTLSALLLFLLFSLHSAFSENYINESFSEYGIKSIGIYTEAYPDVRSSNFVFEVAAIKSNRILQDIRRFRYRYCNFDLTTPPLTTPEYPLYGTTSSRTDDILDWELELFLRDLDWKTGVINEFTEGSLTELLAYASEKEFDAVLVVRYTPIIYFLPIENYIENNYTGNYSADTGKIKKGTGLIPSLELYDSASGTRLWYSAYHTGHQIITEKQDFQYYVDAADRFFAHTDAAPEIEAVHKMIELTLNNAEAFFPKASESGARTVTPDNKNRIQHLFWTDYPSYSYFGNQWGIGYSLEYIGAYDINYKDTYIVDSPETTAGTIANAIMHKISIPFYSYGKRNLSLEPSAHFGFMPTTGANITYTDIKDDHHEGYYEEVVTDVANMSVTSLGLDLALKYFLRVTDNFSAYIGLTGSIASWWQKIEAYKTQSSEFTESYNGLYTNYDTNIILNGSIIAGVKWESKMPFEIFASLTPVGPGNGLMLSAGARFIPFTYGFIDPHATNIADNLQGY